jgi:hypothetical protein
VPGTIEYQKAKLKSRSLGGETYRALQKEERRQEKLIKAVTGKSKNVELRATKGGVVRGVSEKRSKSALGAEPLVTGPRNNQTPTLAGLNRLSKAPGVPGQQRKIERARARTQDVVRQTKPVPLAPYRKGYRPKPTIEQRAQVAQAKAQTPPKEIGANRKLPKPKVKQYAFKQQRRQIAFADRKNRKVVANPRASLKARNRAAEELIKTGAARGETESQYQRRRKAERRRVALAKRAGGIDSVSLPRSEKLTLAKAKKAALKPFADVGKALTKIGPASRDPKKISQDWGLPGAAGKAAVGLGAASVEPIVSAAKGDKKAFATVSRAGVATPKQQGKDYGSLALKVPVYTAQAIAENPDEQLTRLAKDTGDMLKSIPAGVLMAVEQGPETVWEQIKKDYSRRYGPLLEGRDKEFRERLKREGVTSEVLDSLTAITIVGKGAGTAAQGLAKSGRLGQGAQRIALRAPARKGNVRAVLDEGPVKPSKNFFANVVLRGVDTARGARAARERRLDIESGGKRKVSERTARADEIRAITGEGVPVPALQPSKKAARKPLGGGESVRVSGDAGVYAATRLRDRGVVEELGLKPAEVRGLRNSLDAALTREGLKLGQKNPGQSKIGLDLDLPENQVAALERVLDSKAAVVRRPTGDAIRTVEMPKTKLGKLRQDVRLGAEAQVVPKFFDSRFIGQSATIRRKIARLASAAYVSMRVEQREWEKQFGKRLRELSEDEQKGFFYAQAFGIRTPEQARAYLGPHRDAILRTREELKQWESEKDLITGDLWQVFNEVPRIDEILKAPEKVFTPKLAQFADDMRVEARRLGRMDPGLRGGRRQMKMAEMGSQARMLGVRLEDYAEDVDNPTRAEVQAYIRDAEIKRREAGLENPGFFRGEGDDNTPYSLWAVGGTRAVQTDKRKRFVLTDYGASNTDPQAFARGMMNNIKRRYNWNKTADLFEMFASPIYRDMAPAQLARALRNSDIDPDEVVAWSSRLYENRESEIAAAIRQAERDAPDDALGISRANLDLGDNPQDGQARVREAIEASVLAGGDTPLVAQLEARAAATAPGRATPSGAFEETKWTLIPKAAYEEIFDATKPSGAGLRTLGVLQGKVSRVLLANPVWLQFQVASNAFLTGLVDGTGPLTFIKAQVWWNKLPEDIKQAVSPYVGIHRWYDDQNRIGASRFKRGPLNDLVDTYRGWKTTPFWQRGTELNPLTAFFKVDNAQNNYFRRAVLYNRVKREAFKQMGEDMGMAIRLQKQILDSVNLKSLGPEEQMRYLLSRRDLIEEHAKHVDSVLGNWTSYTAFERRVMSRFLIFYGFIRFSTKLTFYTMPMKHPLTSEIMLKLGQMQNQELKRIFGADIPPWEVGNYYGKDGLIRIEAARLNPYFNLYQAIVGNSREQLVTDSNKKNQKYELGPKFGGLNPVTIFSYMPPYMALVADQLVQMQTGLGGKPWTTNSNASYKMLPVSPVGPKDRLQIIWNSVFRLSPYYRALEQVGLPGRAPNTPFGPLRGKQTTDSTWLTPNPVEYSRDDSDGRSRYRYNKKVMRDQAENVTDAVSETLLSGFKPTDGRPKIESAQKFEKDTAKKGKKKAKRKGSGPAFGGGGSGPAFK